MASGIMASGIMASGITASMGQGEGDAGERNTAEHAKYGNAITAALRSPRWRAIRQSVRVFGDPRLEKVSVLVREG
jgi:hypothetical protein